MTRVAQGLLQKCCPYMLLHSAHVREGCLYHGHPNSMWGLYHKLLGFLDGKLV